eukprot:Gb_25973 [translate_table: standard]
MFLHYDFCNFCGLYYVCIYDVTGKSFIFISYFNFFTVAIITVRLTARCLVEVNNQVLWKSVVSKITFCRWQ